MEKDVILTGIRSNEEPTLGNYLGAFQPMVELQRERVIVGGFQLNMFVPDLHSFTTPIDHKKLYGNTFNNLKYFIAAGLDFQNENTYIYRQSFIPAHSELTVILNNFAYFGELNRMTQFKEKSDEFKQKSVSVGLFDYPVLMAADILLYGARWIPVGDDQQQHLEFARDLGERFNNKFGDIFTLPESIDKQLDFSKRIEGVRIRSLRSPDKKMSKSIDDPGGTILLSDSPDEAKEKIMSATTDNEGSIDWNWDKQPGVTNLLQILQILGSSSQHEVLSQWQGKSSYGELKSAVAEAVAAWLASFQDSLAGVDDKAVEAKLKASEQEMSVVAAEQLHKVQQAVGLRP